MRYQIYTARYGYSVWDSFKRVFVGQQNVAQDAAQKQANLFNAAQITEEDHSKAIRKLMKKIRTSAGHYIVHTPNGTYQIDDYAEWTYRGRVGKPRWMLTYPGEYGPDAEFSTLRDTLDQIENDLDWELNTRGITPQELSVLSENNNLHADDSPWRSS